MGKLRVHELAKELGKENKDILDALENMGIQVSSHMSVIEDDTCEKIRRKFVKKTMTKEPENMNEKNNETAGTTPGEGKPKKKNIIQVFRPQNSKTGMVRPGQRPGTARPGARPQGAKPPVKAGEQGAARPQGNRSAAPGHAPAKKAETAAKPQERASAVSATQTQPETNRLQGAEDEAKTQNRTQTGTRTQGQSRQSQNTGAGRGQNQGRTQGNRGYGQGQERNQNNRNQNQNSSGRFSNSRDGRDGARNSSGRSDGRFQGQRNDRNQDRNQGERSFQGRNQGNRMPSIPKAAMDTKPMEKEGRVKNERGSRGDRRNEKPERGDRLDRMERNSRGGQKNLSKNRNQNKNSKPAAAPKPAEKQEDVIKTLTLPETLTIKELADKMKVQPAAIVKKLFLQGTMVTVNQEIDFDTAEEIALDYNFICEKEEKVDVLAELLKEEEDPEESLVPRPPVVCVMGHVDHGKTSLLDAIRNTHVIDREAGGITQHIGASVVTCNGQKITFLDTPGHEAFTAMRMRGANSTDIAILVVAADDGVMPQTVEAINHAKAAGIEIIVAVNKIDKPSANVERVKQEMTEYGLIPEDWGGSTIFVPVSAHTHEGIDTLLEMILLTAEVLELKANPNRRARGLVIEAQLDKGRGPVATVLVQKGTLHVGDPICAGACHGKVRAMMDDKGRRVKEAGPSMPVEILGFSDVPGAGEIFIAPETEKEARNFAETFISEGREKLLEETKTKMSLDDLFSQIQAGNLKELNLIVKADVQGSVEAVKQSLLKLSNDEVVVKIIHAGVGAINESDVILASASNAIIIGFNVRPDAMAKSTAEREGVDVRLYRVIYDAIADVEAAMKGMLDPIYEEKVIGHAEVRQIFKASGVGTIAGSYVLDGVFQRGCSARIFRDGEKLFEGALASLRRFKDDVKEVKAGYECGFVFEKFNDIKEGDQVEAFVMVEVPR